MMEVNVWKDLEIITLFHSTAKVGETNDHYKFQFIQFITVQ